MKKLPIKKNIEDLLERESDIYPGIFKVNGRNLYVKLTSEIPNSPVDIRLKDYEEPKKAVEDVITCAKVYNGLVKEGMYHPKTKIIAYKDKKENLVLLMVMPKLLKLSELDRASRNASINSMKKKLEFLKEKYQFKKDDLSFDIDYSLNWGEDEKGNVYFYDPHITEKGYKGILELAEKMGIK